MQFSMFRDILGAVQYVQRYFRYSSCVKRYSRYSCVFRDIPGTVQYVLRYYKYSSVCSEIL